MTNDLSHFASSSFAAIPQSPLPESQSYYQAEGYYYGYHAGLRAAPLKQPADGLAWVSVICAALGWFLVPLPLFIPAIICGWRSRCRSRAAGRSPSGWALAGIIAGWCLMVIEVIVVLAIILQMRMLRHM
jgi:hypothetical protein